MTNEFLEVIPPELDSPFISDRGVLIIAKKIKKIEMR